MTTPSPPDEATDATGAVVDTHTHLVPRALFEAARRQESWHGVDFALTPEGKLSWSAGDHRWVLPWPDPGQTLSERLEIMDAQRVDAHVLSISPAMFWYDWPADRAAAMAREVNSYLGAAVERWPGRYQALAQLPMQDPHAAVSELEYAVGALGLAGAMIGTNVNGVDWDARELYPVLEAAAGLDAMLFVHPANGRFPGQGARYHLPDVVGSPLETTMAFASMIFGGIFDRLPDLRVCLAHGGGFACIGLGRMDHARRARQECQEVAGLPSDYARRVYLDSLTHSHQALRFLLDSIGATQVVLGTDHPADMAQADPVSWIEAAPLTDGERHGVLRGNVRALLGKKSGALTGR